jgi:hypothetical protein
MSTRSLSDIKKELQYQSPKQLLEICLQIIKLKKENKGLVEYILFDSNDLPGFIALNKNQVDLEFESLERNAYSNKKILRKILKNITLQIKYCKDKQFDIEILMCFCKNMMAKNLHLQNSLLENMLFAQLKKITKAIETVHEDLRYDYKKELQDLMDL